MFTQMFTRRSLTAIALTASLAASLAGANAQTPAPGAAPAAPKPVVTAPAVTAPAVKPPAVTAPTITAPAAETRVMKPAVQPVVDINTADKATLEKLKGIGPARADAIIKGRPYKGKDELVEKKILPQSVYDGLKDELVARQKN
jgi:DNA uptake protein ComE-like DNA-binding protein